MRRFKPLLFVIIPLLVALLVGYLLRNHNFQVLNTRGVVGDKERQLMIYATLLSLAVIIPVFVMTITIATKYNERNTKARYRPDWDHNTALETLWWGLPCAIILALAVLAWQSSHQLDPYKKLVSDKKPLKVQVIALDWKWLFIYPDQGIATVNYLQIPTDTPVEFQITADAPMNSFWVPQLGGQVYAMAGMSTQLSLMATVPGLYNGSSANISGKGFAGMKFLVNATDDNDFDTWVGSVRNASMLLNAETYNKLAQPSEYDQVAFYTVAQSPYDKVVLKYMTPAMAGSQNVDYTGDDSAVRSIHGLEGHY